MDNLRRFFLTVSIIIFIVLFVGGFITALNYDPKEVQREPGDPTPLPAIGEIYNAEEYKHKDLFNDNILFIITPDKNSSAVNFIMTKYNPVNQNLNILIIPDDLKVADKSDSNKVYTLGDYYKNKSGKEVASYVTSLLEIKVDKYCAFSYKEFNSFIKEFGTITFDIPYGLKFISTSSENISYSTGINYKKGEISLTGDSVINLIKFINDDYGALDGDIVEYYDNLYENTTAKEIHSLMSDDFIYNLINGFTKKFTTDNQDEINNSFNMLTETSDNNIDENVLTGLTFKLGQIKKEKIKFYQLSGDYQNNNGFYFVYNGDIVKKENNEIKSAEEIISLAFS